MEGNSLNIGAEKREPQLDIIEKQSVSAEPKKDASTITAA